VKGRTWNWIRGSGGLTVDSMRPVAEEIWKRTRNVDRGRWRRRQLKTQLSYSSQKTKLRRVVKQHEKLGFYV